MNGQEQRASVIAGLREVAAFLEANPDLPVSRYWALTAITGEGTGIARGDDEAGTAQVDAAARVLGTEATGTGHYRATRQFSGVAYEVLRIAAEHTRKYEERTSYQRNIQVDTPGGES